MLEKDRFVSRILTLLKYLKNVPENEPLFLVRAQDFLSDETVMYWANRADELRVNEEKINEARNLARQMRHYRPKKYPD